MEGLEHRVLLLNDDRCAIAEDYADLIRIASSFAPSLMEPLSSRSIRHQPRSLSYDLKADSAFAALVLGNPVWRAAGISISIFNLWSGNSALKKSARFAPTSRLFRAAPPSCPRKKWREIFSVAQKPLNPEKRANFAWRCRRPSICHKRSHSSTQFTVKRYAWMHEVAASIELVLDKIQNYTSCLDLLFVHLKHYRASFVLHNTSL